MQQSRQSISFVCPESSLFLADATVALLADATDAHPFSGFHLAEGHANYETTLRVMTNQTRVRISLAIQICKLALVQDPVETVQIQGAKKSGF